MLLFNEQLSQCLMPYETMIDMELLAFYDKKVWSTFLPPSMSSLYTRSSSLALSSLRLALNPTKRLILYCISTVSLAQYKQL